MDLFPANSLVFEELNSKAEQLEEKLKTDVIQYIGPINPQYKGYFISEIEKSLGKLNIRNYLSL